jgi:D-glycero-D-manno-heptose 1,7-bisphosphate phosphatase
MVMPPKFAVFVDRDGTSCFDKHYLADPDSLELMPTVTEGIRKLNRAGIPVIVVTNQSGIGRGYFTEETLNTIHERLKEMLAKKGAKVDDIFFYPHLPDAGCFCKKPAPGLLLHAREKYGLDLLKSFVIGDRMLDVEMAHAVGAIVVLVRRRATSTISGKRLGTRRTRQIFGLRTSQERWSKSFCWSQNRRPCPVLRMKSKLAMTWLLAYLESFEQQILVRRVSDDLSR